MGLCQALQATLRSSPLQPHYADRPADIGYAMIFPSMTVLKILFVQIAAVLVGG